MVSKLMHYKHWQIFLLLLGLPIIFEIIAISIVATNADMRTITAIYPWMLILFSAILFTYILTLGTNLHRKLPASVKMNLTAFKVCLIIPFTYLLLVSLYLLFLLSKNNWRSIEFADVQMIIPFHILSMICIFYCMYFIAKEVKSIEMNRRVQPSEFIGDFFLFWIFPIGIWFIQPRVNKIFQEDYASEVGLFTQIN